MWGASYGVHGVNHVGYIMLHKLKSIGTCSAIKWVGQSSLSFVGNQIIQMRTWQLSIKYNYLYLWDKNICHASRRGGGGEVGVSD